LFNTAVSIAGETDTLREFSVAYHVGSSFSFLSLISGGGLTNRPTALQLLPAFSDAATSSRDWRRSQRPSPLIVKPDVLAPVAAAEWAALQAAST